jgi:hypothetical protein
MCLTDGQRRSRRLVPAALVVGRIQLEVLVVVGVGLGVVVVDRAARAAGVLSEHLTT